MPKFRTSFKGYDKAEVDAYLHKTTESWESKLREMEECVKRLKEENDYLYRKNSDYHRNEERVSGAILKAMQVKSDLEEELRTKIRLEEDRLKIFKSKWTAYARGINNANADRVIRDVDGYIRAFETEFVKEASRDLGIVDDSISPAERSYLSEKARLSGLKEPESEKSEAEKMSAASLFKANREESDARDPFGFYEE